jgi:hypothetical protein
VSRVPSPRLAAEVGRPSAVGLVYAQRISAVHSQALADLLPLLARASASRSLPLAALKFGGLHLAGVIDVAARGASDLDLLLPAERADEGAAMLRELGFQMRAGDGPGAEHQLAPFADAQGRLVELHLHVPGVRTPPSRSFATFDHLHAAGLLTRVELDGAPLWCPVRPLLAAHALAHGIAQHGLAPRTYPLMQMVGDLIDLGYARAPIDAEVHRWIDAEVSARECAAASDLCRGLVDADDRLFDSQAASDGAGLLRHIVAGSLDGEYSRSLRPAYVLRPLSHRSRLVAIARELAGIVFPSSARLARIHGKPRGRLEALALRLARPFLLLNRWAGRAVRAVWRRPGA